MKSVLLELLEKGDFERLAAYSRSHKRVLSLLTGMTYDPRPLIAWRAVQCLGIAAREIAGFDPEFVRGHLRRLSWLMSDESGGIGWRAPEAIGEIIFQNPVQFADFIPPLFHFLDLEEEDAPRFRAGTLYAIGRVATAKPDSIDLIIERVLACLEDPSPQTRLMALWCLIQCRYQGPIPGLDKLNSDQSRAALYEDGQITVLSVGDLARRLSSL